MKIEDKEMWGWYEFERKRFSHIYPSEGVVRMCSPDGFKNYESEGIGKVVRVKIQALDGKESK